MNATWLEKFAVPPRSAQSVPGEIEREHERLVVGRGSEVGQFDGAGTQMSPEELLELCVQLELVDAAIIALDAGETEVARAQLQALAPAARDLGHGWERDGVDRCDGEKRIGGGSLDER
jgi:hypothetical protein